MSKVMDEVMKESVCASVSESVVQDGGCARNFWASEFEPGDLVCIRWSQADDDFMMGVTALSDAAECVQEKIATVLDWVNDPVRQYDAEQWDHEQIRAWDEIGELNYLAEERFEVESLDWARLAILSEGLAELEVTGDRALGAVGREVQVARAAAEYLADVYVMTASRQVSESELESEILEFCADEGLELVEFDSEPASMEMSAQSAESGYDLPAFTVEVLQGTLTARVK